MVLSPSTVSEAVAHSFNNRDEVKRSQSCVCFHCFARFTPDEIELWSDSIDPNDDDPGALRDDNARYPGMTAICPQCEYDSVLGDASGCDLSEGFLALLHDHWHTSEEPKAEQGRAPNP